MVDPIEARSKKWTTEVYYSGATCCSCKSGREMVIGLEKGAVLVSCASRNSMGSTHASACSICADCAHELGVLW